MTATAVLCVSGALGFVIVAFGFPDWQVAVESAQVVAGLVAYPRDNSFYIYHLKLWTVLHQVCALLLAAGMSEITASMLLTGVQGMVTFQALAMFVYALSRNGVLAVASVIVVIVSGTGEVGVTYPIFLLGTAHTYGALGLSLFVLTAALIGCGWYRAGLLLVGLTPAIHPSLGAWLAVIVGVALVMDVRAARVIVSRGWRAFAAGFGVSAVSLIVHLLMSRGIPPVSSDVASRYVDAFTTLWDEHRQPVRLTHLGVRINLVALAVAGVWLGVKPRFDRGHPPLAAGFDEVPTEVRPGSSPARTGVRPGSEHSRPSENGADKASDSGTTRVRAGYDPGLTPVEAGTKRGLTPVEAATEPGRTLLWVVVAATAVSVGFAILSWVPPERLPQWLVMFMPTRLLNVGTMTFTALVIGLWGSIRRPWARWMTVALAILLVIGRRSLLWAWLQQRGWLETHPRIDPAGVLATATILLIGYAIAARFGRFTTPPIPDARRATPATFVVLVAMTAALIWIGSGPVLTARSAESVYRDRSNDLLFQTAARGRGLLLTGGDLYLIQLRTRRPILLNGGALDSLPYAPESAPAMDRVLRNVYGIDLFTPPPGTPKMAVVPSAYNRDLWQRWTPDRWQQIKRDYNVTQVIVPANWQLQLPIVAQNRHYLLYELP